MTGAERRNDMLSRIKSSAVPVSGKEMARIYEVSRQVIVQDVALLRAAGNDIDKQRLYTPCRTGGKPGI